MHSSGMHSSSVTPACTCVALAPTLPVSAVRYGEDSTHQDPLLICDTSARLPFCAVSAGATVGGVKAHQVFLNVTHAPSAGVMCEHTTLIHSLQVLHPPCRRAWAAVAAAPSLLSTAKAAHSLGMKAAELLRICKPACWRAKAAYPHKHASNEFMVVLCD
jgi:hypothetical protein